MLKVSVCTDQTLYGFFRTGDPKCRVLGPSGPTIFFMSLSVWQMEAGRAAGRLVAIPAMVWTSSSACLFAFWRALKDPPVVGEHCRASAPGGVDVAGAVSQDWCWMLHVGGASLVA